MRVHDVMTEGVQTISPAAKADEAWNLMRTKHIHHLVVTTGDRVVGVLSDRDTGGRSGAPVGENRAVAELMTEPVITVEPTATVKKAANLMRGRSVGCLVVTNAGRAIGIVTVSDLLELVGRGLDRTAGTTTRWTLKHRVPHRKVKQTTGSW